VARESKGALVVALTRRHAARRTLTIAAPSLPLVLSRDQLAILRAIQSGPDGQGAGSTEREIEQQFPDHLHFLRQLDAEGYVEVVKIEAEEPELSPPHARIYRITDKGEAALQQSAPSL